MLSSLTTSAAFAFTSPLQISMFAPITLIMIPITCFENERDAQLKFKQDLIDPSNKLSSWDIKEDCCQWTGVVCDNFTCHVRKIQLRSPYEDSEKEALGGKRNPSLLDLKHLQYLDLTLNYFDGAYIPSFIGSIATLRYLNLSGAGFSGTIPPQLGNVTTMRYLDLRSNYGLLCENLQWLSRLVLLRHLDMSDVDLSKALDWLQHNNLTGELPQTLRNCSSLLVIDLGENKLTGTVPPWMGNASLGLIVLDLRSNNFLGNLPFELCRLSSLQILDVAHNNLFGPVPRCFANFSIMAKISNSSYSMYWSSPHSTLEFQDNANLVAKGREVEYRTTLGLVVDF
ncbi:hypothetical protein RHGRI_008240 [Rhododendron griersonianum]|uniref:Leucine-rich repeat-containing N-terminal plant-type domain-containing protein n=1 Tax=Rhododendron griersonianum TaxID=479676 RepID=A0AAV6KZG9_9ERIC|nr:hypothetical protein RHGRI_008240 [Rhododendron griersonianum]